MSLIPGWDSITGAHSWSNIYFWLSITALLFLGVFEVVSHRYSERKDELAAIEQEAIKKSHDDEIARLHREAADANERAGQANERAAVANQKAESLRQENLKMGMALLPRRLILGDLWPLIEELGKQPGKRALIAVVPDWEAATLAHDIGGVLERWGHWDVKETSDIPPGFIGEGVTIVTLDKTPANSDGTVTMKMSSSVKALFNLLERALGPPRTREFMGVAWRPERPEWPKTTLGGFVVARDDVVILVGARPLSLAFPMVGPDTAPAAPAK